MRSVNGVSWPRQGYAVDGRSGNDNAAHATLRIVGEKPLRLDQRGGWDSHPRLRGFSPTSCLLLHPRDGRHFFFGGGAAFTGAAFAPFLGFFFSLPCELLPFPITRTSVRDR